MRSIGPRTAIKLFAALKRAFAAVTLEDIWAFLLIVVIRSHPPEFRYIRLTAENGHEVSTRRDSGRIMQVTGGLGFPMSMCAAEEPRKRSSKAVGKPGVTSAIRRLALLFVTTVGG